MVQSARMTHAKSTSSAAILIPVLTLALGTALAANEKMIPTDWHPSLSDVETDYKNQLQPNEQSRAGQQRLNDLSGRLSDIYDAEVFIVYVQLFARLQPQEQRQLLAEQKKWLHERPAWAEKQVQSKSCSLAILEYNAAFNEITAKRIATLQHRLQTKIKATERKE